MATFCGKTKEYGAVRDGGGSPCGEGGGVTDPTQSEGPEAGADEFARLGGEVANVLRAAQSAADTVRDQARQEAETLRTEAAAEADRQREEAAADADRQREEAAAEADRVRSEAGTEAERLRTEAGEEAARLRGEAEQEVADLRAAAEGDRAEAEKAREEARLEAERTVSDAQDRAQRILDALRDREVEARVHVDQAIERLQSMRSELSLFAGGAAAIDLDAPGGARVVAEHDEETGDEKTGDEETGDEKTGDEGPAEGGDESEGAPADHEGSEKEPVPPVRDPAEARQASTESVDGAVRAGVARAVSQYFAGKREEGPREGESS
jgi:F0F1-type ATP synthase membrane subunit b/b'